ncbi:hypothetical protein FRAAL4670 [Frankia alni ACN14a]|uniref:Uncharacterized protein n=1 Tax=Frankia alni (strain DSM 45986 / CECT 9034 / ACN14a) TaxID=326424 RepID=Q0RGS4_FRAAA|nr:hypothetical protein FRAAL4670 [Frankia alni ACN14a]
MCGFRRLRSDSIRLLARGRVDMVGGKLSVEDPRIDRSARRVVTSSRSADTGRPRPTTFTDVSSLNHLPRRVPTRPGSVVEQQGEPPRP